MQLEKKKLIDNCVISTEQVFQLLQDDRSTIKIKQCSFIRTSNKKNLFYKLIKSTYDNTVDWDSIDFLIINLYKWNELRCINKLKIKMMAYFVAVVRCHFHWLIDWLVFNTNFEVNTKKIDKAKKK